MADQYETKIQKALHVVETEEQETSSPFIKLSSGVILRLKKVSCYLSLSGLRGVRNIWLILLTSLLCGRIRSRI